MISKISIALDFQTFLARNDSLPMSDVMKFARAVESESLARKIRMMPSYILNSHSHL